MKRTINRVLARLAMFIVAIILGAIAVAQAQKGFEENRLAKNPQAASMAMQNQAVTPSSGAQFAPIPVADRSAVGRSHSSESPQATATNVDSFEDDFDPPPPARRSDPGEYYVTDDYSTDNDFDYADQASATGDYRDDFSSSPRADIRPTAAEFESNEPDFDELPLAAPPLRNEVELPPLDDQPANLAPGQPPANFGAPPTMQFVDDTQATGPPPTLGGNLHRNPGQDSPDDDFTEPPAQMPPRPTSAQAQLSANGNRAPFAPPSQDLRLDSRAGSFDNERVTSELTIRGEPNNAFSGPRAEPSHPAASGFGQQSFDAMPQTNHPYAATAAGGVEGVGKPGPPELEGPQSPSLTVAKKSPREVQVGKPARFHITVRNSGKVAAHEVLIRDEVPHGTQLIDTNPPAQRGSEGSIVWEMGTLRPGAETTVMMELMPMQEGDIGSVATVTFEAAASARTLVTRPQLKLEHTSARQVLVGENVVFSIKLSNPGTGIATNVTIEENVPEGLQHYNGNELEYQVGNLKPGESRVLELTLKADKPGFVQNVLRARADTNLVVEDVCELEVVAPQLRVEITGPRKRFLERKASYEIHVANPGTATAHNVELVAHLPRALKFLSTTNSGNYDPRRHVVVWNLAQLPAQEMGTVQVETTPMKAGDHSIQVDARANMGLSDSVEHQVSVEGIAALLYTVTDLQDPIEVGGQTTYVIQIVNQGSKTATNLQLGALIPAGMEPINGEGPTRVNISGPRVIFEPLARLEPQSDTTYKIHVKGTSPGDKRVQVQLISDDISEPITKEESTHVYSDE